MKRLVFLLLKCAGTVLFANELVPAHKKIVMTTKEFWLFIVGLIVFITGIVLMWFVPAVVSALVILAGSFLIVISDNETSLM